jgi:hypothetical protein
VPEYAKAIIAGIVGYALLTGIIVLIRIIAAYIVFKVLTGVLNAA